MVMWVWCNVLKLVVCVVLVRVRLAWLLLF